MHGHSGGGEVILSVDVVVEGPARAPAGTPVHVVVRDTSLVDVEAPLVVEATSEVGAGAATRLARVTLEIPAAALERPRRLSVFAHVDVDGDGALSPGDLITTRSYPIAPAAGEARLQVVVVPI